MTSFLWHTQLSSIYSSYALSDFKKLTYAVTAKTFFKSQLWGVTRYIRYSMKNYPHDGTNSRKNTCLTETFWEGVDRPEPFDMFSSDFESACKNKMDASFNCVCAGSTSLVRSTYFILIFFSIVIPCRHWQHTSSSYCNSLCDDYFHILYLRETFLGRFSPSTAERSWVGNDWLSTEIVQSLFSTWTALMALISIFILL